MNVIQYKRRLKSFKVDANIKKAIKQNSDEIINLNKINLDKGLNYENRVVGYYKERTAQFAKKLKPNKPKTANTKYNFDWTGSFINGIFITYEDYKIKFKSRGMGGSKKSVFITKNKLLGLLDVQSKIVNNDILTPALRNLFKSHLEK